MSSIRNRFQRLDLGTEPQDTLQAVDVAVIDSGVDGSHEAFSDIAEMRQFLVDGEDIRELDGRCNNDELGHGTAVAGIIGKIAPHVRLWDFRIINPGRSDSTSNLMSALQYCIDHGIKLINLSLAVSPKHKRKLQTFCETAYRHGIVVVAAQRNDPLEDYGFPAELAFAISVNNGSYETDFDFDYATRVMPTFSANGVDVLAPYPGGGEKPVTGTSFATPVISGLCALFLGHEPELDSYELKTLLRWHAKR